MYFNLLLWFSLLLLLLLLPILLSIINNKLKANKLKHPPGPPKLPLIGNILDLFSGLHNRTYSQLSKKYGPIMLIQLGAVPTVVISSSEAAEKILKTHEANCCRRPVLTVVSKFTYNNIDFLFSPYNDYYKEMKRICSVNLFSAKRVQSFQFIKEEEVHFLIDSITQTSNSATPVNLSEVLLSFTSNVISKVAFGKNVREMGFNSYQVINDGLQVIESLALSDYFPILGPIVDKFRGLNGRAERAFSKFDSFFQKLVDDHRLEGQRQQQQQHEHEDIIDVLLKIQKDQVGTSGIQLKDEHIKAVLTNIFFAGTDTSAITMTWAMAELARKPNLMKKVQDQIRNCIGNKARVSEIDLHKLQYLKAVVKETLRLHPPSTILFREATSQFNIDGFEIYPKTHVHINIWAIGQDPKAWEMPEEFIPERFMDDNGIDFRGRHEFLPFGSGRRMCPGIHLATSLMELTLANILYCFDWKLPCGMVNEEDICMEEEAAVTVYKKMPLQLVPVKFK